ncbi:RTA-like protein, partial [Peziza echinospora]
FEYRPSLAMNGLLTALFAIALLSNIVQGIKYKTWSFMAVMSIGCALEIGGYIGRLLAYNDMISEGPFLLQIVLLTISPAFFAAGIYLCLSRIIVIFGADISRIPPKAYTWLFVSCDFVSLILQGTGGGMASTNSKSPQMGTNVMLGGLGFQVFTLVLFIALCAEYGLRVRSTLASGERQLDPMHASLRNSMRFKAFLVALAVSTIAILIRSIFRVIELSQGWDGDLMGNQTTFFILEGIMVILAVLVLNACHPGWSLQEAY